MTTDLETQIRDYAEYFDSTLDVVDATAIVEGRSRLAAVSPKRRSKGWLVAAAAAGITLLIGAAVFLAMSRAVDQPVTTEPPTTAPPTTAPSTTAPLTTAPPTTEPPATAIESGLPGFELSDVPSFRATVALRTTSGNALFEVTYAGSAGAFRIDVLELQPTEPGFTLLADDVDIEGGPGSYYVWDGADRRAFFAADEKLIHRFSGAADHTEDGLAALTWPTGSWAERCGSGLNLLGAEHLELPPEIVAGRSTIHLQCELRDSIYELWIDEETGVLLRATGTGPAIHMTLAAALRGFAEVVEDPATIEITEIEYQPFLATDTFSLALPAGWKDPDAVELPDRPAFYARVSASFEGVTAVYELWYRGLDGWRMVTLQRDGDGEFHQAPDSFSVWTGGIHGSYDSLRNAAATYDEYQDPLWVLGLTADPIDLVEQDCEQTGQADHLGLRVEQYVCVDDEKWVDPVSGLVTRRLGTGLGTPSHEILELDFDPVFDDDLFVFDPPDDATFDDPPEPLDPPIGSDHPLVGRDAGPILAQIVDETSLDLSDYRGRPLLVLVWAPWCSLCIENLEIAQTVAARRADVETVTIGASGSEADIAAVVADKGVTLPVINARADEYFEELSLSGVPVNLFINPDGTVAAVFFTILNPDAYEEIYNQAGW